MPTSKLTASGSTATRKPTQFSRDSRKKIYLVASGSARFFHERGREFPWRNESNLYRLAVAEILLQKTRARSAQPVYEQLISQFPSAVDLANASELLLEQILLPLGLSRKRAAQLRSMAYEVERVGTTVFDDWRRLLKDVPGIGSYAARAIACFGRGEHIGIVDANVARIFRRVFGVPSADPRAVIYQRLADAVAASAESPRATNFGLLDIGATICLPKAHCFKCPFEEFCPKYGVTALSRFPTRLC